MWTNENRARYKRDHLRHPSDVTDEEWARRTAHSPGEARGPQARGEHEGGVQRAKQALQAKIAKGHVRAEHGMPVALYSQGPASFATLSEERPSFASRGTLFLETRHSVAAAQHREPLLLPVGLGRHAGSPS